MQAFLMICIGLLLASCGGEKQPKSTVAAIESGEKTRVEWQKARKPVAIRIEGMEGTRPAWPQLGVYMDVNTTTPEERQALAGAMFTRKGDVYVSANRHALTSDTTATVSVCYPFRKGLGTNDTLRLIAPFDENLYGVETRRIIGTTIQPTFRLQSSMALLRIVCEGDDLRDRLDGITLIGDDIYTEGGYQPYTGRWFDKKANGSLQAGSTDCLLNNGRKHDLYLIPTETACSVTIIIRINGKDHVLRTMLPPLTAGSMTHLSIRKGNEGVAINSSWVEPERSLAYKFRMMPVDSVQTGHYLQRTGRYRRSVTLFPWPWSWKRTASTAKRLPYLIVRDRSYSPETAFQAAGDSRPLTGNEKKALSIRPPASARMTRSSTSQECPIRAIAPWAILMGQPSRKDWWKPMDKPSEFLLWAGEPCCKRRHGIPAVMCPHSVNWPSSITCWNVPSPPR